MDLILHFLAGVTIPLLLMLITKSRKDGVLVTGSFLSLFAGIFKECIIDYWFRYGTPELADITLTWCGGLAVLFIVKTLEAFNLLK